MTKQELIGRISGVVGTPKSTAESVLGVFAMEVAKELAVGGEVSLPGLGKFKAVERGAREARNPATGEKIAVPAKRVAKFRPASALRAALER